MLATIRYLIRTPIERKTGPMLTTALIPSPRQRALATLFGLFVCVLSTNASAGIFGSLGTLRELANEKFEADFFLQAMTDSIGDDLEFINIDMINSNVSGTPLDPTRVEFHASTRDHDFVTWQAGAQFGDMGFGFESVVSLAIFDTSQAYTLPTSPFLVGTFTVDYSGLGLTIGDSVTLDITGVDDGTGSRTTSVAVTKDRGLLTEVTEFIDPTFSSSNGPGARTFTLSSGPPPPPPPAVPEPTSLLITLSGLLAASRIRRRRAS